MRKTFLTILLFFFIIFASGCNIEFHRSLSVEQAEPYVCKVGDTIPFKNVIFDEETEVLKKTAIGIYAYMPGDVLIQTESGYYHIIVKEPGLAFEYTTEQLLKVGDETDILVGITPLDKSQDVTFESMDPTILSVSNDGKVKAIADGITRVKVISEIYNIETEITFIVLKEDEQ